MPTSRPNILIFMTDHQRGDTVLPEHPCITPNLDKLVQQGVTFTQAFCPSPHCCPSRATFMTGLYPSRHGVWNNICNTKRLSPGVNDGVRFWSQDMAEAGYNLIFSGKWHVDTNRDPQDVGWDNRFAGCDRLKDDDWEHWRQVAQTQPEPVDPGFIERPGYGNQVVYRTVDSNGMASFDQQVTETAEAAIREQAASDQPWALFTGCIMPHDPYFAHPDFLAPYLDKDIPLPDNFDDPMTDKPGLYRRMRRGAWGKMSREENRMAMLHYYAMCSQLDAYFGRLLDALDRTGQAENTLVLYGADHGDYAGEHGLFCKGIPAFRGPYHVPAVVRWPKGITNPGRRVDAMVSLADFHPTFTELAVGSSDSSLTGRSLVPFLNDQSPADWRDDMHSQCDGVEVYVTQRAVWTHDWKYVFNGFDEDELYHLAEDPGETTNLAQNPNYAQVVQHMAQRLWRFAHRENDAAHIGYITCSFAPHGPAEAFAETVPAVILNQ